MRSWEAIKLLDEGKKIRCVSWEPGKYIESNKQGISFDNVDSSFNTLDVNTHYQYDEEWEIYAD